MTRIQEERVMWRQLPSKEQKPSEGHWRLEAACREEAREIDTLTSPSFRLPVSR